jgi:hypothetical protein
MSQNEVLPPDRVEWQVDPTGKLNL